MTERQREILQIALKIIADNGYGNLSMRALARASGMKLGALQYHFRTWQDLLRALVDFIAEEIRVRLDARRDSSESLTVREIAEFMLDDTSGDSLLSDNLWPQLWAMEQVEPFVSDLLEDVYAEYLEMLEKALKTAGSQSPHAEGLWLMSMLEGESLFTGSGRRWESDRQLVRDAILELLDVRYGEKI